MRSSAVVGGRPGAWNVFDQAANVENHVTLFEAGEAGRHLGRLFEIAHHALATSSAGAAGAGRRRRPETIPPAEVNQPSRAVFIQGNICRPSDASTRSVPRPMSPMRMMEANTLIVGPVLGLLVDEVGDAGADADELGDDEVGPGPAEQHAHVGIDLGDDPGDHHPRESCRREAPSVSAASSRAGSMRRVVLAMIKTCWKKVPMKMMATFGASSIPMMATARAPNAGAGR